MKLLLVEDNEQLNKALSAVLKRNGYVVDSAFDGEDGLTYLLSCAYDVAILDIMLPRKNGLDVLKSARDNGVQTPIIMLTAKSSTEDKILGLDYGADDYLAKPFSVEELLARIRALSRRKPHIEIAEALSYGDVTLDVEGATLNCGSSSCVLMNKELQIMASLMDAQGRLVSQERLIESAWNSDDTPISDNLWVFVSYLRKKLESIGSKTKIKSVRYQGYYLETNDD